MKSASSITLCLFSISCSLRHVLAKPQISVISSASSCKTKNDSYTILARSIQSLLNERDSSGKTSDYDVGAISSALRSLSTAQAALKKIDGTAHEMYQRTHKSSTNLANEDEDSEEGGNKIGSLKVAGRMSRKAARIGCIADALFTAELCELINLASPSSDDVDKTDEFDRNNNVLYDDEGTLAPWTERKVVLNTTVHASSRHQKNGNYPTISVVVIYEPNYSGGAGSTHGGVDDLLQFSKDDLIEDGQGANSTKEETLSPPRGRYLVILSDHASSNTLSVDELTTAVSILDSAPCQVNVRDGSASVTASVCTPLYHLAGQLVEAIEPVLSGTSLELDTTKESESIGSNGESNVVKSSEPAIHIVGHSLAGGVAALAALILDGTIPSATINKKPARSTKTKGREVDTDDATESKTTAIKKLARGRSSAFCLGPPPCLSPNLRAPFIISIIHGDDIICRTSQATLKRLCERTRHSIKGGVLGRSVGWMTDTLSLTVSGLKSRSKKTEKDRLVVPGKVFLIRPRRIGGGSSSIHEVGDATAGGREAFRAAVLWQLNDILLSGSMLAHHRLDSYIRSLDRVKLSGLADETTTEE